MPSWRDAFRMALPPALVALAVTLLRLAGELRGWSEAWFSRATSGLVPTGAVSWPALGRVLFAYGLLSRGVVALVMFLAMRGRWGTHYDYADMPRVLELPFGTAYLMFAFIPQLVFWLAYTIVLGMVAGTLVAALRARRGEVRG